MKRTLMENTGQTPPLRQLAPLENVTVLRREAPAVFSSDTADSVKGSIAYATNLNKSLRLNEQAVKASRVTPTARSVGIDDCRSAAVCLPESGYLSKAVSLFEGAVLDAAWKTLGEFIVTPTHLISLGISVYYIYNFLKSKVKALGNV